MTQFQIIPGLVVDSEMYEAAESGLALHAPDAPRLTWETFTAVDGWTLVPDDCGQGYKAEFVLRNDAERTLKINSWYLPDLRAGDKPKPHSHPWDFYAFILMGGYTEDRYELDGDTVVTNLGVTHRSGSVNEVPRTLYHEVTEIHDPGRTLTLMVCGAGQRGTWGYLDVRTGEHTRTAPDPGFKDRLRALNPHQN